MLKLAQIFQSDMILQREKPVKIWGETEKDAVVDIWIQGQKAQGKADENGAFLVVLEPLKTSEAEVMIVSTKAEQIKLENIAVGEVWIAGGQSNMEFFMEYEKHIKEERKQCENSRVRFYDVPQIAFEGQLEAFDYSQAGKWRKSNKEEIGYFSAAGYYFEKVLHIELDVPVGIIGCNWGGTRVAAWMDPESVKKAGSIWTDMYEETIAGLDLAAYYENQKTVPLNNQGMLINNPFTRFMLPVTHTPEEMEEFFAQVGADTFDYTQCVLPHTFPGSLYQHMVKKIAGFANRGVLWYQGESDDEMEGGQQIYGAMLTAMIGDWRDLWEEKLPFLIVQLPGWESWLEIENRDYTTIREEQKKVTETVDGTYLCSISDVGEQFDIHPKDKKTVGERLAKLALGHVYGRDILCDPPVFIEANREGGNIVLTFKNVGEGLYIKGDTIKALEVTENGTPIKFVASVSGDKLILGLEKVPENCITVSFAQGKWYQVNLYNSAGIPAIPYRVRS